MKWWMNAEAAIKLKVQASPISERIVDLVNDRQETVGA